MANGGFEIPVDFVTEVKSQGQTLQQFFDQVEREGVDAINKIAAAAKQPIKQVVEFEVKDGKLKQSLRETYDWTEKVERARASAAKKEAQSQMKATNMRRGQIAQLEKIRKAHFDAAGAVKKTGDAAKRTGNELQKAGTKGKAGGMAIVSGFIKAQLVMRAVSEAISAASASMTGMIERVKQVQGLTVAFKAFGLSADDATAALQFTRSVSMQYGADLEQLDTSMRRLTPTIVTMGGSLNDSMIITEALAKRTAALGLNTEKTGRFVEAFAQVMGKGKLQSEELNQQFAELDGALRGQVAAYLKAEYGITNLNDAMQKGEVKAGMFAAAVVHSSQEMKALNNVNLSDMVGQLERGEITLQQFDNVLSTMEIDTFDKMAESFEGTIVAVKRLQVAWDAFVNSAAGGAVMTLIDGAVRILIQSINGLILLVMTVDQAFRDFFNWLTEKLPFLEGVGEALGNMGKSISEWWSQSEKDTAAAIEGFKQVDTEVEETAKSTDQLSDALKNYGTNVQEGDEATAKLVKSTGAARASSEGFAQSLRGEYEALARRKATLGDSAEANGVFKADLDDLNAKVRSEIQVIDKSIRAWQKLAETKGEGHEQAASNIAALEAEKRAIQEQAAVGKELLNNKVQLAEVSPKVTAAVTEEASAFDELSDSLKKNEPKVRELVASSEELADRFNALGGVVTNLGAEFGSTADQSEYLVGAVDDQTSAVQAAIQSYADFVMAGGELSDSQKDLVRDLKATEAQLLATSNAAKQNGQAYQGATVRARYEYDDGGIASKMEEEFWDKHWRTFEQLSMEQSQHLVDELVDNILKAQMSAEESAKAEERRATAANAAAKATEDYAQFLKSQKPSSDGMGIQGIQGIQGTPISGARASGGPVASGSTYQVNELGREGFLSASGRMSEIKVPSFGSWTAPSKGEVIPAHVWAEMKAASAMGGASVPAGLAGASRGGSGGSSSVDNTRITNHVTIQSQSPVQAASELMVSAAKRRRRRFR